MLMLMSKIDETGRETPYKLNATVVPKELSERLKTLNNFSGHVDNRHVCSEIETGRLAKLACIL